VFINKIKLRNYRCFKEKTIDFSSQFVLIEGENGSGKTSILEALHYGCFLKSFRTNRGKDLLHFESDHFFLNIDFQEKQGDENSVQVGVSFEEGPQKRLVKFNQKKIKSYKDLISHYRIVSLTEEDLQLIQGAPEVRRGFLNQLLVLFEPQSTAQLKKYRQILTHRNKLLENEVAGRGAASISELEVWTKQLWEQAIQIQSRRIYYLKELEHKINELLTKHFVKEKFSVRFSYTVKHNIMRESFDAFWNDYREKLQHNERRWGRSLFGPHLDDFTISFQEQKARYFASRGQQKLVVFLIKIALLQKLEEAGMPASLLADDFLTDFDDQRARKCVAILMQLSCQVVVTTPIKSDIFEQASQKSEIQTISL